MIRGEMIYGYYITDTAGSKRFFAEGCSYCRMSTAGEHETDCPCKDIKVADRKTLEVDNTLPWWDRAGTPVMD